MGRRKKNARVQQHARLLGAALIIEQRLKASDSHKTKIKVRPDKKEQKRVGGKSGEGRWCNMQAGEVLDSLWTAQRSVAMEQRRTPFLGAPSLLLHVTHNPSGEA